MIDKINRKSIRFLPLHFFKYRRRAVRIHLITNALQEIFQDVLAHRLGRTKYSVEVASRQNSSPQGCWRRGRGRCRGRRPSPRRRASWPALSRASDSWADENCGSFWRFGRLTCYEQRVTRGFMENINQRIFKNILWQ